MNRVEKFIWIFISFFWTCNALGQEVSIKLGPDQIAVNQVFTITITLQNGQLRSYKNFPDIPGFVKQGTSSSSTTSFNNGQMSSSHSITMNYIPRKQGTFKLNPFKMTVNGRNISSPGKTIKVGPPAKRKPRRSWFDFGRDPFEGFFERKQPSKKEFVEVDADAFLALTTDKKEVYRGEGFTVTLAFYVSNKNRADMRFYELGEQLTEIIKKIKPPSCWEENFNIDNVSGEPITLNNQQYTQYKIYQATYFPLNTDEIKFPSVGLELIKYKVAARPSFLGRNRQEDYQTFYSKEKVIKVKELPPHPLKESVAVGDYRLKEAINLKSLKTGQSFDYSFNITGIGNISAINKPKLVIREDLEIYDPNITQNINRSSGRVTGTKSFSYYGIPNEPGEYHMGDYFSWIYFNPYADKYDTLTSEIVLAVIGESKKNEYIMSNDMGSFYDKIDLESNELSYVGDSGIMKLITNILSVVMLALTAILIFRK